MHHSMPLELYPNPPSKPAGVDILYVSGLSTELRFSRSALLWTGHTRTSQLWAMCVGFGMGGGHSTTCASPTQISTLPIISAPAPRHCARAVKGMDSKSIGLCPQGFESPRCRLLHHSGPLEPYPNPLSKPPGADLLYVSGLATELRFSRSALLWTGHTPTSQLRAMCVGFGIGDAWEGGMVPPLLHQHR